MTGKRAKPPKCKYIHENGKGCDRPARVRGWCDTHYAIERYRMIREGEWKPKRHNRVVLAADEALALDRFLAYRKKHGVWPSTAELLAKIKASETPLVATGLSRLINRGYLRESLYPARGIRRLSRRSVLEEKEE